LQVRDAQQEEYDIMKKLLKIALALALAAALLIPGLAALADPGETFSFPSSSSTVVGSVGFIDEDEIGWFWSVARGDSVSETLSSSIPAIGGATLDIEVVRNFLYTDAQVDWDVVINGVVVDSFTVDAAFIGVVHREMQFDPILGPDYDVALIVTNEVAPGWGSHSLAYAGAYAHSIRLIATDKVTGGGTVDWLNGRVTYGFTAQQTGLDHEAVGQFVIQARDSDPTIRIKASIVSLAVDGNNAWMGGVVTQSNYAGFEVGDEFIIRVVDNGEGKKAARDQVSSMYWGLGSDVSTMPLLDLLDWTNGNVQVHDAG
jgi:hypothetical protein